MHKSKPFLERVKKRIRIILLAWITITVVLLFFSNVGRVYLMTTVGISLSVVLVVQIVREWKYVIEIGIVNSTIRIKYIEGSKILTFDAPIDSIQVNLKSTTSSSGTCYRLHLHTPNNSLKIDDTHDWSTKEIADLYKIIKEFRKEPLNFRDKTMLYNINKL